MTTNRELAELYCEAVDTGQTCDKIDALTRLFDGFTKERDEQKARADRAETDAAVWRRRYETEGRQSDIARISRLEKVVEAARKLEDEMYIPPRLRNRLGDAIGALDSAQPAPPVRTCSHRPDFENCPNCGDPDKPAPDAILKNPDNRFPWENENGNDPLGPEWSGPPDLCRACGGMILPENRRIADGCPCNSARGVNHGLVPKNTCTCVACDPDQTGSTRIGPARFAPDARDERIRELEAEVARLRSGYPALLEAEERIRVACADLREMTCMPHMYLVRAARHRVEHIARELEGKDSANIDSGQPIPTSEHSSGHLKPSHLSPIYQLRIFIQHWRLGRW